MIVDWGDDDQSGSDDPDNYYKNHRGLQEDDDAEGGYSSSLSKCDLCSSGSELCEWGLTADSCDPNYFTYAHTYRCSENDLDTLEACSYSGANIENSPCIEDEQCVYQPRVHVRDNWGWCAGECGDESQDGCYDYDGSIASSYTNDHCDTENIFGYDNWIYYNKLIYVEP